MLKIKKIIKYLLIALTCGFGSVMFISFTFEDYLIEFSNFNPNWQMYLFLIMFFGGVLSFFVSKAFIFITKKWPLSRSKKAKTGISVATVLFAVLFSRLVYTSVYDSASLTGKLCLQLFLLFSIETLAYVIVLAFEPKTTN